VLGARAQQPVAQSKLLEQIRAQIVPPVSFMQ
jgi:hypothetical protein